MTFFSKTEMDFSSENCLFFDILFFTFLDVQAVENEINYFIKTL